VQKTTKLEEPAISWVACSNSWSRDSSSSGNSAQPNHTNLVLNLEVRTLQQDRLAGRTVRAGQFPKLPSFKAGQVNPKFAALSEKRASASLWPFAFLSLRLYQSPILTYTKSDLTAQPIQSPPPSHTCLNH
jgi:hypothetical protein